MFPVDKEAQKHVSETSLRVAGRHRHLDLARKSSPKLPGSKHAPRQGYAYLHHSAAPRTFPILQLAVDESDYRCGHYIQSYEDRDLEFRTQLNSPSRRPNQVLQSTCFGAEHSE